MVRVGVNTLNLPTKLELQACECLCVFCMKDPFHLSLNIQLLLFSHEIIDYTVRYTGSVPFS